MTKVQENKIELPSARLKEIEITEYIRENLDKVAIAEGFKKYELIVDHGSSIGDGFVGIMIKVKIQEINSEKLLNVLAKVPPASLETRAFMQLMKFFEREVFLYNHILPEFIALQKKMGIVPTHGFFNFPKVYLADYSVEKDDAILIMEDLRNFGFRMWNKAQPVNYEHSKLLMIALGRLHALSFAMRIKKPDTFEKYKSLNDYISESFKEGMHKSYMEGCMRKAMDVLEPSDISSREKFQKIADNFVEVMMTVADLDLIEPYGVVAHGDAWINNYLFHYDENNQPDYIVLIDWQISRFCSPVADLLYFIFVCTDREMRAKHYEELLKAYHDSLGECLQKMGGNADEQFSFKTFQDHLHKFGKFGAVIASSMIHMLLTKKEDIPDFDYVANKTDNTEVMEALWDKFSNANDDFTERMRGVIKDVIDYGYLQ